MTEKPKQPEQRTVTLVAPADFRDCIYLTAGEPIRFSREGEARVPKPIAEKHLRPGWHIRP